MKYNTIVLRLYFIISIRWDNQLCWQIYRVKCANEGTRDTSLTKKNYLLADEKDVHKCWRSIPPIYILFLGSVALRGIVSCIIAPGKPLSSFLFYSSSNHPHLHSHPLPPRQDATGILNPVFQHWWIRFARKLSPYVSGGEFLLRPSFFSISVLPEKPHEWISLWRVTFENSLVVQLNYFGEKFQTISLKIRPPHTLTS